MSQIRKHLLSLIAAALVTASMLPVARANEPLQLSMSHFAVIIEEADEGTQERLLPFDEALHAKPGSVIEFHLVARNSSEKSLDDILLTVPVPKGTVFLAGSELFERSIGLLQFSIDGGRVFRAPPIRYELQREDGSMVTTTATAEMYTDLRLVFLRPLAPGEEVAFSYRVWVN